MIKYHQTPEGVNTNHKIIDSDNTSNQTIDFFWLILIWITHVVVYLTYTLGKLVVAEAALATNSFPVFIFSWL